MVRHRETYVHQSAMIFSFGQSQQERIEVDVLDYETCAGR